jgi:hypothetical protein
MVAAMLSYAAVLESSGAIIFRLASAGREIPGRYDARLDD